MKILMVCIGNICRSPIAEGVLQHFLQQRGKLNWTVDSAAMTDYHIGEPPHRLSQKVCQEHGIDISKQKARLFKIEDLKEYDKIYAMSTDVLEMINRKSSKKLANEKAMLFLNELRPGKNESVPDPWFGTDSDYYLVYEIIEEACFKIIEKYTETS